VPRSRFSAELLESVKDAGREASIMELIPRTAETCPDLTMEQRMELIMTVFFGGPEERKKKSLRGRKPTWSLDESMAICAKLRREGKLPPIPTAERERGRQSAVKAFKVRRYKAGTFHCDDCGIRPPTPRGAANGILIGHHIIPVSMGGGHGDDNLTLICLTCHALAHLELRLIDDPKEEDAIA
jgi:hypothetical protein